MSAPDQSHSRSAVIKAIAGNFIVTVGKAAAAFLSGSGAMLAETLHSSVDTLNQCLLLVGYHRSLRQPTRKHPYGFGAEAHFWGLLAAIGILVFGGGFSIYHGVHGILEPETPDHIFTALIVLAFATVVEGWVLVSVILNLLANKGDSGLLDYIRTQGPGTLTVLLEDAVAVLGCLVAAAALILVQITGNGIFDAIAQLVIGSMLGVIGLYLIWNNRGALVGRAVRDDELNRLRTFIEDLEGIERVTELKTRQLTASTYTLKAEVVFSGGSLAGHIMREFVDQARDANTEKKMYEILGRYADALFVQQARHVDIMERKITEHFPGVMYIDLEPHLRDELPENEPGNESVSPAPLSLQ
ncbi:MAG: cation diffusion facilitator family transporter [Leptospiraceae bacterium]|nr:cation diffusion facilitator family transporter [Leptospiraceae bacterium]MCB1314660.1 cation diffusion facilitator family transporter [Leptospiraceae bacterium]MCB1320443.1 cation diffusion facilitator family transporter [Leptospiraceae bacterium]